MDWGQVVSTAAGLFGGGDEGPSPAEVQAAIRGQYEAGGGLGTHLAKMGAPEDLAGMLYGAARGEALPGEQSIFDRMYAVGQTARDLQFDRDMEAFRNTGLQMGSYDPQRGGTDIDRSGTQSNRFGRYMDQRVLQGDDFRASLLQNAFGEAYRRVSKAASFSESAGRYLGDHMAGAFGISKDMRRPDDSFFRRLGTMAGAGKFDFLGDIFKGPDYNPQKTEFGTQIPGQFGRWESQLDRAAADAQARADRERAAETAIGDPNNWSGPRPAQTPESLLAASQGYRESFFNDPWLSAGVDGYDVYDGSWGEYFGPSLYGASMGGYDPASYTTDPYISEPMEGYVNRLAGPGYKYHPENIAGLEFEDLADEEWGSMASRYYTDRY